MKRLLAVYAAMVLIVGSFAWGGVTYAANYGEGRYGECNYSEGCSITISAPADVALTVIPSASGTTCSIAGDAVTVSTGSSAGYTLLLSSDTSVTSLVALDNATITAVSGTPVAPASLASEQWGYRVDGSYGFGAGPTSAVNNSGIPALSFAGLSAYASPTVISGESGPVVDSVTNVWIGMCASLVPLANTYTRDIVHTAVMN